MAERGTFNALISNGQWFFATATSRWHWLTRRAPFRHATLSDPPLQVDFSTLTIDEHWQPFQAGESLLFRAGEVVQCSRHGARTAPSDVGSLVAISN